MIDITQPAAFPVGTGIYYQEVQHVMWSHAQYLIAFTVKLHPYVYNAIMDIIGTLAPGPAF